MRVLGINAIFHDPAAALVVDGTVVAAAEEERFSRRKHGKRPVPFAAWELPELSAAWCLASAGIDVDSLDAVAYSFDPGLCRDAAELGLSDPWDWLRVDYARRAPQFLAAALPGLDPEKVRFVPHHVAHAASAGLAAPPAGDDTAVLVLDGRGEVASHLAGVYRDGRLSPLRSQSLPHSLGLLYEDLTRHLGFLHSSDEYKVMALASYGTPKHLGMLRDLVRVTDDGGFQVERIDWASMAKARTADGEMTDEHADLAASVQTRLEEVILDLSRWLHDASGGASTLAMAGGVALNCVANARIAAEGPYRNVWVQPAAGDAGTALGAALHVAGELGDRSTPMAGADLGRGWSDEELEAELRRAALPYTRPASITAEAARVLADNGIVAWYQGRSEYGPRALGHRSLLAHPGDPDTTRRMNDVKGREQFRPIAPMVRAERFAEIFEGVYPSPYMLFVHRVKPEWRDRIPAVTHVDGTARVQTVHSETEPVVAELLAEFERRTGLPVVVNTSLNTAGRPMVDTPREAMELFGSAPVDLLALGPFAVHRRALGGAR
ncbi:MULTISPECIES: carbamoyltransferase C-terminal domain-containing protein [Micromonospora]|uniref:Carbamoyltransferase n=1 Tax=Micromonospora solifontis TaxID=2487138 RepID=A0ABX9WG79_9ACTN|nr:MULTISPECIES: carbamoyltransferase C-terminal domain-containing protein [Micromonospora]NES15554.1 carbamoyltransferase [Micromonospora sp. PPF5-17B]NES36876.1 carbamoyltransferase [Micromonospora solifontis]NES55219.1 carbamoyltransferase [Micromonospora sp. PPF5-6]RNL98928.1 carbamoyltransferase [Micromonospora solifontis]